MHLYPHTNIHTHCPFHYRASDPDEVYRVHEMKLQREQLQEEESNLDHLIQMCKHELSLLTENQENWQYPTISLIVILSTVLSIASW